MSFDAEAQIVRELGKFLSKRVFTEDLNQYYGPQLKKTALADAEVEYKDHKSNTIYAEFIKKSIKTF